MSSIKKLVAFAGFFVLAVLLLRTATGVFRAFQETTVDFSVTENQDGSKTYIASQTKAFVRSWAVYTTFAGDKPPKAMAGVKFHALPNVIWEVYPLPEELFPQGEPTADFGKPMVAYTLLHLNQAHTTVVWQWSNSWIPLLSAIGIVVLFLCGAKSKKE